jgi:hypothetical protein
MTLLDENEAVTEMERQNKLGANVAASSDVNFASSNFISIFALRQSSVNRAPDLNSCTMEISRKRRNVYCRFVSVTA